MITQVVISYLLSQRESQCKAGESQMLRGCLCVSQPRAKPFTFDISPGSEAVRVLVPTPSRAEGCQEVGLARGQEGNEKTEEGLHSAFCLSYKRNIAIY